MKASDLNAVALNGLGKMGVDWAATLLEAGYRVVGYDVSESGRASAIERVGSGLKWIARKRRADDADFLAAASARFTVCDSEAAFVEQARGCQVFLECIFEELTLKNEMLGRIVPQLPEPVVVWTNTSSLSVAAMAAASGRPSRFLGAHGMNPVYMMPGVEVIQHPGLDPRALQFTLDVLTHCGKIAFVAADVPGFWVNKNLVPYCLDACRMLERGEITVDDGDKGLNTCLGHPQGVFKLLDLIGLDTLTRIAVAMYKATQDPRFYPPLLLLRLFKAGEFGQKSQAGFYRWEGFKAVAARDFSAHRLVDVDALLSL